MLLSVQHNVKMNHSPQKHHCRKRPALEDRAGSFRVTRSQGGPYHPYFRGSGVASPREVPETRFSSVIPGGAATLADAVGVNGRPAAADERPDGRAFPSAGKPANACAAERPA